MGKSKELEVIDNCHDCGVCCFHMGYPAFMLPRAPKSVDELQSKESQELLRAGWTQEELLRGHEGESHWHKLPHVLRTEWESFVQNYQRAGDLDGRCFWLDEETNLCKHHQHRPQVCRDFEIGNPECRQWRKNYQIGE